MWQIRKVFCALVGNLPGSLCSCQPFVGGNGPQFNTQGKPSPSCWVLDTLVTYIHTSDLPNFRITCSKWASFVGSRLRSEFTIDLTGNSNTLVSRKTGRFIYAMPATCQLPFDSFKLSELRLGVASLDRAFMTHVVPQIRKLHLVTRTPFPNQFWALMKKLETLEELELALHAEITSSAWEDKNIGAPILRKLVRVKWLTSEFNTAEGEENEIVFGTEFLSKFYVTVQDSLQSLTLTSGRHLQTISNLGHFPVLTSLTISNLSQWDLLVLNEMGENKGLQLSEFVCSVVASDVRPGALDRFLSCQAGSLLHLQIGGGTSATNGVNGVDRLDIRLPDSFPHLQVLILELSSNLRYARVNFAETFPRLEELCVTLDEYSAEENVYFWEDFIQTPPASSCWKSVDSLWRLEVVGVLLRSTDSLYEMMLLFPSVQSLTLGRPSKQALTLLWSLWPMLKELKIISACPQIDEVLTGIPTSICRRLLVDRRFEGKETEIMLNPYLDGSIPSIRDLKYLQRLEMNGRTTSQKLQSLSCLPSDVAVHFGFMRLPELTRLVVQRSLISGEATFLFARDHFPPWGSCRIDQIKFEFDETIDAFQFHRNNQQFMKLLCRYPHSNLHNLPSFLTSLLIQGRLDL